MDTNFYIDNRKAEDFGIINFNPILLISGDYNAFKNGFKGGGIYMSSGLYKSDSFILPIYIGGAVDFRTRIKDVHLPSLKNHRHHNFPLQRSWNKHGQENFVWWCLEIIDNPTRKSCCVLEQKYLDWYRPFVDELGGFNICKIAGGGSAANPKKFKIIDPSGNIIEGENLTKWGRDNDIPSITYLLQEGACTHKGYRNYNDYAKSENMLLRFKAKAIENGENIASSFKLVNPQGQLIEGKNLQRFCEKNGLSHTTYVCLGLLLNKKQDTHLGWRRYEEGIELKPFERQKYYFSNPQGKVYETESLINLAKRFNLGRAYLSLLYNKHILKYKDWRYASEEEIKIYKNNNFWRKGLWKALNWTKNNSINNI